MNVISLGPGLVPEGAAQGHGLTIEEFDARRGIYAPTDDLVSELKLERQIAFHARARRNGSPDMPPAQAGIHDNLHEEFLVQLEGLRMRSGRIAVGQSAQVVELRPEPDPIAA